MYIIVLLIFRKNAREVDTNEEKEITRELGTLKCTKHVVVSSADGNIFAVFPLVVPR